MQTLPERWFSSRIQRDFQWDIRCRWRQWLHISFSSYRCELQVSKGFFNFCFKKNENKENYNYVISSICYHTVCCYLYFRSIIVTWIICVHDFCNDTINICRVFFKKIWWNRCGLCALSKYLKPFLQWWIWARPCMWSRRVICSYNLVE